MGLLIKATSIKAKKQGCADCVDNTSQFLPYYGQQGLVKFYECDHLKCPYCGNEKYEVEWKIYEGVTV